MEDANTSPLKPRQNIQITLLTPTDDAQIQGNGTSDTSKPDERLKFFFRVKIGGSSQPQATQTPTFTGTTSTDLFTEQQSNSKLEIAFGPQAPPTDLSKTSDRFGFGNPFAPPNSKDKFTDLFDPNQPLKNQEILKGIAGNETVEQKTDTLQNSLLNAETADTESSSTPRELIFDSLKGEILGRPYYKSSSDQHSSVKFTIYDPDDNFRPQISKLENIEVEAGFVNGYKRNIFVGKILDIARKLPEGTIIEAVDNSYELQQTTSGVNPSTPTTTSSILSTTLTPTSSDGYTVKSSFTGEAGIYGSNDSSLFAIHESLPLNTTVRITNTKNNKSIVASITKNAAPSGGRIIDLSDTAGKALDMLGGGVAQVKVEVVEKSKNIPQTLNNLIANNKDFKVTDFQKQISLQDSSGENLFARKSNAEAFSADIPGLKFSETGFADLSKQGEMLFQQSKMASAELEAALTGKILTTRGNTLFSVAPGEGQPSGVILDYSTNRAAFIDYPVISKRTNLNLQPAVGAVTVQSYDVTNKQVIGATVVTPGEVKQHPTGIIQAPEWGSIKLSDRIIPGSPYTWGDATKEGSRVPESKEIMRGIIRIATIITDLTKETGQAKWKINSWYRPPKVNRQQGGKSNSRHLYGDAVDFYYSDEGSFFAFYRKLNETWPGGVALGNRPKYNPPFIHIDARHQAGEGRARWFY